MENNHTFIHFGDIVKSKKVKIIILLSLMVGAGYAVSQSVGRSSVSCSAQEGNSSTFFDCEQQSQGSQDEFVKDGLGGTLKLNNTNPFDSNPVEVSNLTVGVNGRGGATINSSGEIEVLDATGRVTHRNLGPTSVKPFVSTAPSIAVVGDAGSSPVNINLQSPISDVVSGSALFIGNANEININVSGKHGQDGRPAGEFASLQFLKGDFGQSSITSTIAQRLSQGSISVPGLTASDLLSGDVACEDLSETGGLYPVNGSPTSNFATATTYKARETVVSRSVCERNVSQEFAIQTVCARPPMVNATTRCDYPALYRRVPMWSRPTEAKKIEMSCSDTVPNGEWETKCGQEKFIVAASAFRTEYVTLEPSQEIKNGMNHTIHHHYDKSFDGNLKMAGGCNRQLGYLGYSTIGTTGDLNSIISKINTLPSEGAFLAGASDECSGTSPKKMDVYSKLGFLTQKYPYKALPGSEEERLAPSIVSPRGVANAQLDGNTKYEDIRKLTYWTSRSITASEYNEQTTAKRTRYDSRNKSSDLGESRMIPANFDGIDPASKPDDDSRADFFLGLRNLGFEVPNIDDALIGYESLTAKRNTFQNGKTLGEIICEVGDGTSYETGGMSENETCDSYLSRKFNAGSSKDHKFRESIVYTFKKPHSGLMLKSVSPTTGLTTYTRSLAQTNIKPRILYIPGDYKIEPIKSIELCTEIAIDDDSSILRSFESPAFIGPEYASGESFGTAPFLPEAGSVGDLSDIASSRIRTNFDNTGYQSPAMHITHYGSSFMKMNNIPVKSKNSSCESKVVNLELTTIEALKLEEFKNSNGMAIVVTPSSSSDVKITVYMSPIKTPKDNISLKYNQGVQPGLYVPKISVAPMFLDLDTNLYNESGTSVVGTLCNDGLSASSSNSGVDGVAAAVWAGYGAPMMIGGTSAGVPCSQDSRWDNQNVDFQSLSSLYYGGYAKANLKMSNKFISYITLKYAKPSDPSLNINTLPGSQYNSVANQENLAFSRNKPRFIKRLDGFRLIDKTSTSINRKHLNIPNSGYTILTDRVGFGSQIVGFSYDKGAPTAVCKADSIVNNIKYPTKLISRKAESNAGGFFENANITTSSEVADQYGSIISQVPSKFFSKSFTPLSMQDVSISGSNEDPTDLVRDYNSLLFSHKNITANDLIGPSSGKLTEIGNRIKDISSGSTAEETENVSCVDGFDGQVCVNNRTKHYKTSCTLSGFESKSENGSYWPNYVCHSFDSRYRAAKNVPAFYTETMASRDRLGHNIWYSLRPWTQYALGHVNDNAPCGNVEYIPNPSNPELAGSYSSAANWISKINNTSDGHSRKSHCYHSEDIHTGHFLPFLRTKQSIYYGQHGLPSTAEGQEILRNAKLSSYDINTGITTYGDLPKSSKVSSESIGDIVDNRLLDIDGNDDTLDYEITRAGDIDGNGGLWNNTNLYLPPFGVNQDKVTVKFGRFYNHREIREIRVDGKEYCVWWGFNDNFEWGCKKYLDMCPSEIKSAFSSLRQDPFGAYRMASGLSGVSASLSSFNLAYLAGASLFCKYVNVRSGSPATASLATFHGAPKAVGPEGRAWISDSSNNNASDEYEPITGAIKVGAVLTGSSNDQFQYIDDTSTYARASFSEPDIEWVGMSGHLFNNCSDDMTKTITPRSFSSIDVSNFHLISENNYIKSKSKQVAKNLYLPTGILMSESGSLYFGPIDTEAVIAENIIGPAPVITNSQRRDSPTSDGWDNVSIFDYQSSNHTNMLLVGDHTKRINHKVAVYKPGTFAAELTKDNSSYDNTITLSRDANLVDDELYVATIGRVKYDAQTDTAPNSEVDYDYTYESPLALAPEVLLAFFAHSDSYSEGMINNSSSPIQVSPMSSEFSTQSPQYLNDIFRPLLSQGQIDNLRNKSILVNRVRDGGSEPNYGGMLIAVGGRLESKISFSWSWHQKSIHAGVKSLTTGASGGTVTTDAVKSGVAVKYASDGNNFGVMGDMTDETILRKPDGTADSTKSKIKRSQGITTADANGARLVARKFQIVPIDQNDSNINGGTSSSFYMDPESDERDIASARDAYYFSEAVCSKTRREILKTAFAFKLSSDNSSGTNEDYINPFHDVCVASALRNIEGVGVAINTSTTEDARPITVDDALSDNEKNIYWDYVRVVVETPVANSEDAPFLDVANPPSCQVGHLKVSQNYKFNTDVPTVMFKASTGWKYIDQGNVEHSALNVGEEKKCPEPWNHEVGSVYSNLFVNKNRCYNMSTGESIEDTRTDKTSMICPITAEATTSGVFTASYIEETPSDFYPEGTAFDASFFPPVIGSVKAVYSISSGDRVSLTQSNSSNPATVEFIKPDATELKSGWVTADSLVVPSCVAIPYNREGGFYENSSSNPKLLPRWSFSSVEKKFGELDSHIVKTIPKQALLPDAGGASVNISNAAYSCEEVIADGSKLQSSQPEARVVNTDGTVQEPTDSGISDPCFNGAGDVSCFTYPINYVWTGGAGANLTLRQFTPWSSERTDGDTVNAPGCDIYNDSESVAKENIFPTINASNDGTFAIGSGNLARIFSLNSSGAIDSSRGTERFVTGGTWQQVGVEQQVLTKANSKSPVSCRIYYDPASGSDYCDSNIPITYETVEGHQLTLKSEPGENGGHAGYAAILTTKKPETLNLSSEGGRAGQAGSKEIPGGTSVTDRLVCYSTNVNKTNMSGQTDASDDALLNPWIKIYRFNKSLISVSDSNDGNAGRGGDTNTSFSWGIMPESIKWLQDRVMEQSKSESQNNN